MSIIPKFKLPALASLVLDRYFEFYTWTSPAACPIVTPNIRYTKPKGWPCSPPPPWKPVPPQYPLSPWLTLSVHLIVQALLLDSPWMSLSLLPYTFCTTISSQFYLQNRARMWLFHTITSDTTIISHLDKCNCFPTDLSTFTFDCLYSIQTRILILIFQNFIYQISP